jgi:hypothetical protein
MSPIRQAVNALNDRLVMADCIGQALDIAGENDAPPWVYVYRQQIQSIQEAAEVLENLLNEGDHVRLN